MHKNPVRGGKTLVNTGFAAHCTTRKSTRSSRAIRAALAIISAALLFVCGIFGGLSWMPVAGGVLKPMTAHAAEVITISANSLSFSTQYGTGNFTNLGRLSISSGGVIEFEDSNGNPIGSPVSVGSVSEEIILQLEINVAINEIDLSYPGPITIQDAGSLTVNNSFINASNLTINNNGGLIINSSTASNNGTINNNTALTINNGVSFTNNGTMRNNNGGIVTNNGSMKNDTNGSFTNEGTMYNILNGRVTNDGVMTNSGSMTNGPNANFTNNNTMNNTGSGTVTNNGRMTNSGSMTNDANASFTNNNIMINTGTGTVTNNGTVNNQDGATLSNSGRFTNNQTIHNAGTLTNNDNGTFDNNGTINVTGNGKINGNITGSGKINYSSTPHPPATPAPSPQGEGSCATGHASYTWQTVTSADAHNDGEMVFACAGCGQVLYRVTLSAYDPFQKVTAEKIRNAAQGATVEITTSRWISFHRSVMEALAARPDVTLTISFLDGEYRGNRRIVTIPAGYDTLSLLNGTDYCGFLYLGSKFGLH